MSQEKIFALILEKDSVIAKFVISKYRPSDGSFGNHPYWVLTCVDMESHYLSVVLENKPRPGEARPHTIVLHIPHSAVVCVLETTKDALPLDLAKDWKNWVS
ncbi:hypothetical protein LOD73_09780 [Xylella fastidiosa subsp. multiplex]|uniref:hypothetical protein n=1 Tax=Xylella fastidiosa TaxID=2371 RepID=UPI00097B5078|nr:hypothetical protein [Xylella fastidiosa]MDC6412889.1 hypothetical protein [Xylella fastidiosa subsp. multiplex]MDD0863776.1 hypothetical protein [Xylella fastidiosa subsp. multiplex]MDD0866370.1 hypothetical protein [Xylella fastidiosa subsp. multiplex]MDD0872563.1 hypothetical protein [Xylella fastidiosa subsp. multiplex]MDD0874934.1 hypothetical protein [Xylella fastidiosa subsp. multiplex]